MNALAWALRGNDVAALKTLSKHARAYLETHGSWSVPFAADAATAYEKITTSIERFALAGVEGEPAKRQAAALWFVAKAQQLGFELPDAPADGGEAVTFCVRALERWRIKTFADDQARAESWVRAMSTACGRRDGVNATKGRWKKKDTPPKAK